MNKETPFAYERAVRLGSQSRLALLLVVALTMGLLLFLLCALPVGARLSPQAAGSAQVLQSTTVWIDPPAGAIDVGELITFSVRISDVTNLYGAQFTLVFTPGFADVLDDDPGKTGVQIEPGDCLSLDFVARNEADNAAGTIEYALTQLSPSPPFTGSCTLANIHFEGVQPGTSPLHFDQVILADPDGMPIPANMVDGTLLVITRGVSISPNSQSAVEPGRVVTYSHQVRNESNVADTFDVTHASSKGWPVTYSTPLALDAGKSMTLVVSIPVPAGALSGTVDTTVLTVTSTSEPGVSDTVVDATTVLQVAGATFLPDAAHAADPEETVVYSHTLTNSGNGPDVFDLGHNSNQGWAVAYDTPLALGAGQTTTVLVSVTVPVSAASGTVDTTVVTATSRADASVAAAVTDTTTVRQVAGLILIPDHLGPADPDTVVEYLHVLTNTGNGTDTFDLVHTSSEGWDVAYDTPVTLGSGQASTVTVTISVPASVPSGTVDTTVLTSTSQYDPAVFDSVTDTTVVGQQVDLSFYPDRDGLAVPDATAVYSHTLLNSGNGPDIFDLTHLSSQSWALAYHTPVALGPGLTATIQISVAVPAGVLSGTLDTSLITATSRSDPAFFDVVVDTTTVAQQAGVSLYPNRAASADPGQTVVYSHTVTNTGNWTDTVGLSATSSEGWSYSLSSPAEMLAPGATSTVYLTLTVPSDAPAGVVDETTLTAVSQAGGGVEASVTDVTTVTQIADLVFTPDRTGSAVGGETVTLTHFLTNTGNGLDVFSFTHESDHGYTVTYPPSLSLAAGATTSVVVSITVPSAVLSGTVDTTIVTATSQVDPAIAQAVQDVITITRLVGVEMAPSLAQRADPGDVVTYTHSLTNAGNYTDTFTLTFVSSEGWAVNLTPSRTLVLAPWENMVITLVVSVPATTTLGTVDHTVVTATSQTDLNISASITDTTRVEEDVFRIYLPLTLRNSP